MPIFSFPNITALTAAALGVLQVLLMLYVVAGRAQYRAGLGDGGHDGLARRIRIHGNFTENAPIFLIMLGLLEVSGRNPGLVGWLGPIFIAIRLSHAIGLSTLFGPGANPFRFVGAVGTASCLAVTAIALALAVN